MIGVWTPAIWAARMASVSPRGWMPRTTEKRKFSTSSLGFPSAEYARLEIWLISPEAKS